MATYSLTTQNTLGQMCVVEVIANNENSNPQAILDLAAAVALWQADATVPPAQPPA